MVSVRLFGQDLKKDILDMHSYIDKLEEFQMTVVYAGGDTNDLNEEGIVSVFVSKEGIFYNLEESSIVINESNVILVNDEEKTLIYSNNIKTKKKFREFDFQKNMIKGLDSIISNADSIYYADNNGSKTYYLRDKDGYFNLIEMQFSGVFLNQIIYYYNPVFVEEVGLKAINKIKIIEKPVFDKQLLKTVWYYTILNGETVPTETFKNYILIYNESSEEYFD